METNEELGNSRSQFAELRKILQQNHQYFLEHQPEMSESSVQMYQGFMQAMDVARNCMHLANEDYGSLIDQYSSLAENYRGCIDQLKAAMQINKRMWSYLDEPTKNEFLDSWKVQDV